MTPSRLFFAALIAAAPLAAWASTDTERGLEIAVEADRRDIGFGDTTVDLVMELTNRHGQTSVRRLSTRTLEVTDDGDKSISVFSEPRDVNGTAMLTFSHKASDDDQWLYLPALKRVKRISSSNKSGPFMGSEFAYEDLSSQEVEKYTYRWLRDETLDGQPVFVIERIPVDVNSGYTRQIAWIDQHEYRMQKVEFYDRKGALLKTLTAGQFEKYLGRYWRPLEMVMINHQTGKSTRLVFENYRFQTGLKDGDFNHNSLKRAR